MANRARERAAVVVAELGGYYYETPRGARLVFAIEPIEIHSFDDVHRWTMRYEAFAAEIAGCDLACSDPFHLFYAPRATRDPKRGPESPFTLGDPSALRPIDLPEAPEDTQHQPRPKAGWNTSPEPLDAYTPTPLLADLERAGLVRGVGPLPGSLAITCPNAAAHSTGSAEAIYLSPSWFGGSGAVRCLHQHCREFRDARSWRRAITSSNRLARLAGDGCVCGR